MTVSMPARHSRPSRNFPKHKIVAVAPALPEPFAVPALMDGGIELRERQQPIAADETALIAGPAEPGKPAPDRAGLEMPVLAFEHQERRMLLQDPLGALQDAELGALDVD